MPHPARLALPAAAALLLVAATPAQAQRYRYYAPPPPQARSAIGGALRVGISAPSGSVAPGEPLRDELGAQLDVTGELGVRVVPELLLGGYVGVGLGSPGARYDAFCAYADCSAATVRVGLLAHYDFAPWSPMSPWIAYGFGFAASRASGDDRFGGEFESSLAGLELGHLMAGLDFRPGGGPVGVGLYLDWTFGVYRTWHWHDPSGTASSGRVGDATVHQWFSIGPRISF